MSEGGRPAFRYRDGVLDSLEADYAVEGAVLRADVDHLIAELLREGLIERIGSQ